MSLVKHICNRALLHNFAQFWLRKRIHHFLLRDLGGNLNLIWLLVECGGPPLPPTSEFELAHSNSLEGKSNRWMERPT